LKRTGLRKWRMSLLLPESMDDVHESCVFLRFSWATTVFRDGQGNFLVNDSTLMSKGKARVSDMTAAFDHGTTQARQGGLDGRSLLSLWR
jgi:hypothetical protein